MSLQRSGLDECARTEGVQDNDGGQGNIVNFSRDGIASCPLAPLLRRDIRCGTAPRGIEEPLLSSCRQRPVGTTTPLSTSVFLSPHRGALIFRATMSTVPPPRTFQDSSPDMGESSSQTPSTGAAFDYFPTGGSQGGDGDEAEKVRLLHRWQIQVCDKVTLS